MTSIIALRAYFLQAAADMILRRHDETIIFVAYRYRFNYNDVLEANIHAMMQGMALALQTH